MALRRLLGHLFVNVPGRHPEPQHGRQRRVVQHNPDCLTDDGVFDSIDAAGKHSKGQSRVETEVEKHMPSLPTDADCAVVHYVCDDGGEEAEQHDRRAGIHDRVQKLRRVRGERQHLLQIH